MSELTVRERGTKTQASAEGSEGQIMPVKVKASRNEDSLRNGNGTDREPYYNGLERERVASIQRRRMLGATMEVIVERGVANVTVSHVVARSGVSRRTFYELFQDREDCLLAAVDDALCGATERVLEAYRAPGTWQDRTRETLTAILEFFDEDRIKGRLLVTETLAAGPTILQRRQQVLNALITAIDQGRDQAGHNNELSRLTAEGVIGAVLSVIHARMLQATEIPLLPLRNDLMAIIMLPYLGSATASRELNRSTPNKPTQPHAKNPGALNQLGTRLTYRTIRVLTAIAAHPDASNRQVANAAGITDPGQVSKLLTRLQHLGLIQKTSQNRSQGEPNAWQLTHKGHDIHHSIATQTVVSD